MIDCHQERISAGRRIRRDDDIYILPIADYMYCPDRYATKKKEDITDGLTQLYSGTHLYSSHNRNALELVYCFWPLYIFFFCTQTMVIFVAINPLC